jgi:hypothetical protein
MANNPFQTPASPWALPPATLGTLFNTSARVTRLQSRWATPVSPFLAIKNTWSSTTQAAAISGMGYALKYLAAGNTSDATNAYNAAIAETFSVETSAPYMYSQSAPYVYAWCNGALSGAQNTALLNLIETNTASLETGIGTLGKFLIDGAGNGGGIGLTGYVFGVCAAQGQAGITDRRTNLRNLIQNMCLYINQQYGEGVWTSYDYIWSLNAACIIAYHIATGEENLLTTRCPAFAGRGEILARMLSSTSGKYYDLMVHNSRLDLTGRFNNAFPDEAWACALQSDVTGDTTMRWVRDQQIANSTPTQWSHLQLISDPTWLGFLFHDGVTGVAPATTGIALNKSFPITGLASFKSGWNAATDIAAEFNCGPNPQNDHAVPNTGHFQLRVGPTWLIAHGYDYSHRGTGGTWEFAVPAGPNEVGNYTMCKSSLSFSPTATAATRLDRDGSASVASTTGSSTAYPLSYSLTNSVRPCWLGGVLGAMSDDGSLAKVTGDMTAAFPQVTSAKRTVGYKRPGSGTFPATFVIYDQFNAPATIGQIRANFWSKFKPTVVSETVLQGSSTAGVTQWGGDNVVFKSGSYQVTIQCVTPFNTINGVGGAGYESFFDAPADATHGYATSGGGNLDFVANGGDARDVAEFLWMNNDAAVPGQIQWRTSFQTTQATAQGEMLFVLTVDATGTTAPSYTKAQALAILTPAAGGPTMPGLTQFAQRKNLDWQNGRADSGLPQLYTALFTTAPADDGTGGVEASFTGYTRFTESTATWGAASGGSPAVATNAVDITFPASGAVGNVTVLAWGQFTALTSGNLWFTDYLGNDTWKEFTGSVASPCTITSPGHTFVNGDQVVVTSKYTPTASLPTLSQGSWNGPLVVAGATADTFTVTSSGTANNASATGGGMVRKITPALITPGDTFKWLTGVLTKTQA